MSQNINKVDHVVFMIRPENLEAARVRFQELLGIGFEGPIEAIDYGVRIYIDWSAGVELMAPVNPEKAKAPVEFLETRGEGVWRIVFGVADNDVAIARAKSLGVEVLFRQEGLVHNDAWRERFETIDEAPLAPVYGVPLSFGDIRRID
jgi:methylmalonyl-CoA/ethylmalonyl-CoA epimerase